MNDYDFYLRHASVHGGDWVGFPLAQKGFAGVEGLAVRPYLHWRPWVPDPASPDDPASGAWGVWQWLMNVGAFDFTQGLAGVPPADGRNAGDIRTDLYAYINLPILELKDVDNAIYSVRMTAFQDALAEPFDINHPVGGWVMQVEFAEVEA